MPETNDTVKSVEAAVEIKAEAKIETKVEKPSNVVSLLVLNCNENPVLHLCLESFHQMAADPNNVEYVVVTKGDLGDLNRNNLKVVNVDENVGSTEALNKAAAVSKGNMLWVLTDNYMCITKNWDRLLTQALTQHGDGVFYGMVDDNLHNKLGVMKNYGCTAPVLGRGGYEKQGEVFAAEILGGGADTAEYRLYTKKVPHCVVDLSNDVKLVFLDRAKWVSPISRSELTESEIEGKNL